jgi:archaeosine synthase beta-subunit
VRSAYPASPRERDRWILERRPPRRLRDPQKAYAALVEEEAIAPGHTVPVATIFLTNRECPWHCLMCDLWKDTLGEATPRGAIPEQIRQALSHLAPARRIKLYNAGSFFDRRAIPPDEHVEIAALVDPFERVVVESHPALVGPAVWRFRDRLRRPGALEVAMGLETIHPDVLPRLNKRMTLDGFRRAAADLLAEGVGLRVFVLAGLPWVSSAEAREWTARSVAFAFDCGASVVSLIPTRTGNGAMDALVRTGEFEVPSLRLLEQGLEDALPAARGLCFADLWDLQTFARCSECFEARLARLAGMNRMQEVFPAVSCRTCGGA